MRPAELLYEFDEDRWLAALEWHALRCAADALTPQQQEAWRHWLLDDDNRRVYAACAQLYRDAQGLEDARTVARISAAHAHQSTPSLWQPLRWTLASAVLAVCAASAVLLRSEARPKPVAITAEHAPDTPSIYRTAARQTRRVRLGDGSTVVLGARTVLEVTFTAQWRALDLKRGEVWFDVVHRSHWPFVVTAGAERIRDLGTAFVVDRESGRTEVTVTQGQVEVSLGHARRTPSRGSGPEADPAAPRRAISGRRTDRRKDPTRQSASGTRLDERPSRVRGRTPRSHRGEPQSLLALAHLGVPRGREPSSHHPGSQSSHSRLAQWIESGSSRCCRPQ